jgi:hypothetical protein
VASLEGIGYSLSVVTRFEGRNETAVALHLGGTCVVGLCISLRQQVVVRKDSWGGACFVNRTSVVATSSEQLEGRKELEKHESTMGWTLVAMWRRTCAAYPVDLTEIACARLRFVYSS